MIIFSLKVLPLLLFPTSALAQVKGQPFTADDSVQTPSKSAAHDSNQVIDDNRRRVVLNRLRETAAALGQLPWQIPEYHDEQPFQVSPTAFGPVVFVFASPYVGGFNHISQINAHGQFGALAAVIWVDAPAGALSPALVPYVRLNLSGGLNCLYLAHDGDDDDVEWWGYVTAGTPATGCNRPTAATPRLRVRRIVYPGYTSQEDFPAVARFEEAAGPAMIGGQPLIGVRCLTGWCQVGPLAGFETKGLGGDNALKNTREGRIRGWHDDQRLAVLNPAGRPMPSPWRATITPVRDLEKIPRSDFDMKWIEVATIWMEGDPVGTKYAQQWGLRKGRNTLQLAFAFGKWHGRIAPLSAANPDGSIPTATFRRLIIDQHQHLDVVVPGTARFRWRQNDDTIWVSCDQGCCKVGVPNS